jgi:hypothetical protein
VHHPFPKFERRFILIIKSAKGVENNKKIFITHIYTFGSNVFFGPLNYKF